jgi:replicative DNA helicase
VSVTEIAPRNDDFERTPPHDVAAEQCVLGGMLLSKDAISDVIEVIRPADHYRPAHQLIHEAILDLYGRGEPADAITVANELTRRGEIARVGGGPYLHTLIASVPTAANAGYYARIVRERAILRRLVEAGTRIVQFGYAGDADADDLVDRAQAEVYAVTERRVGEDYHSLSEIMPGALDEIEAIGSHGGVLTGVPTGFSDLDALTNGLHPGQMIVIAARPAVGKALALDTPLPTPTGWTTMGEVRVGDHLMGADGKPTRVVAATEVMHGRPCYELEFDDGEVIIADENHQWLTWIRRDRRHDEQPHGGTGELSGPVPPQVVTTGELARALRSQTADRSSSYAVALTAPTGAPDANPLVPAHAMAGLGADQAVRPSRKRHVHEDRPHGAPPRTSWRYIVDVRPVPSRPVRCVQVDSEDHLYLAGRGMIPTHNSTLALDFARAAAIKHSMATVLFSLEMGRNEITMRLLSAEARVPMHTMRTGQMNDDDWARLARRMSEVADAPLFIDDSPNMSLMEIRAKCRRLKQRHDLKFVIIDYLQLMSSPKRVENRQQEVSELSRSLKLLAKELEVPVIALSQLNRGPEQRTDKKPLLSDLRESGCLTAGTRILRADTGSEISLGDLLASGERNVLVWSLDDRLRLVPQTMTHAFPSGIKEVFLVRLTSGREIEATANHPFLTLDGWRPLSGLTARSRVAIPRHVPAPLQPQEMPEPELVMLAHLLGDGSFVRNRPIRYASTDEGNLAAVTDAALHFGITAVRDYHPAARCTSLRLPAPYHLTHGRHNPIAAWLDSMGLFGLRSHEKFVPPHIFSLPQNQLALFLHHLWATDGSVTVAKSGAVRVYYSTTSVRLARELQILLLRFGIIARLHAVGNVYGHPQWTLDVKGVKDQWRFLDEIGVHGERGLALIAAQRRLDAMTAAGRFDTIPSGVWERVHQVMKERSITLSYIQAAVGSRSRGDLNANICPTRTRIGRIAQILGDAELEMLATSDVYWDTISSIESIGYQPVYDATVLGTHNFVANGIDLHNSIEQDSDVVILLHREDAYERESPRAGEADLIVAKHRNGPTATVTVAFQGHYSRFVDMAPG